ncbi:MAG: histidine kinase [Saprospiraceae bacterium]|nr:histidine kinase [Saprospiraceae bacterium]
MSFSSVLTLRVVLLALLVALAAGVWVGLEQRWLAVFPLLGAVVMTFGLIRYVNDTNRRLARFFESVRYSDFAIRFASGKEKGGSFEAVNRQFNEVLEAFRQTRAEKEANLLFLNTIVQHLGTGVLAFDRQNNILLSNNAAFQTLGVYRLHHLHELPPRHSALQEFAQNLTSKGKILYQPEPGRQLAVQGVALNLQGRAVRLLTLQNIHPELQRKELDAWRDLTRVLRHEIMNSVTPIVSLVETMQDILPHDDQAAVPSRSDLTDLAEALDVVGSRSRALMDFVQAYRSFSAIPEPKPEPIAARRLLDHVVQLSNANQRTDASIHLEAFVAPEELVIHADAGQIEMVLLNLVKNAREAFQQSEQTDKRITLRAGADDKGKAFIEVEDNGPGIAPELLDEIFIPFFTTKATGTGVGLSISRQIMQLHGGDVRVSSTVGTGTRFVLAF